VQVVWCLFISLPLTLHPSHPSRVSDHPYPEYPSGIGQHAVVVSIFGDDLRSVRFCVLLLFFLCDGACSGMEGNWVDGAFCSDKAGLRDHVGCEKDSGLFLGRGGAGEGLGLRRREGRENASGGKILECRLEICD
jgi:hypothetical protein